MIQEERPERRHKWRSLILLSVYVFLLCVLLAELEIQIEGSAGWASDLPTWRITDPAVTWLFAGRPVTGYHVFLVLFLVTVLHFPLLFAKASIEQESKILWSLVVVAVVWDFLWFALNPSYGITRYSARHVWWFRAWFLGFPVEYFVGIAVSFIFWMLPVCKDRSSAASRACQWGVSTGLLLFLAASVAGVRFMFFGT